MCCMSTNIWTGELTAGSQSKIWNHDNWTNLSHVKKTSFQKYTIFYEAELAGLKTTGEGHPTENTGPQCEVLGQE